MTFNFAPWAIDGARTPASLARMASYAGAAGKAGVIKPQDLRVVSLAVPGVGLRITEGGGVVLNHYLSQPDEAYVVSNPALHTVPPELMPPAQPGTRDYLVCVVVGDPEFNQAGHPFMPSNPLDPQIALNYEYVRIRVLPCTAGARRFEDLGLNYPGLALARLEVPANTTTITNAMITDLRTMIHSRQSTEILLGRQGSPVPVDIWTSPDSAWMNWINEFRPYVQIPSWATSMKVLAHVTGAGATAGHAIAETRIVVDHAGGSFGGPLETLDETSAARMNFMCVWEQNVAAAAGSTAQLTIQARQLFNLPGWFTVDNRTQVAFDVRFAETLV